MGLIIIRSKYSNERWCLCIQEHRYNKHGLSYPIRFLKNNGLLVYLGLYQFILDVNNTCIRTKNSEMHRMTWDTIPQNKSSSGVCPGEFKDNLKASSPIRNDTIWSIKNRRVRNLKFYRIHVCTLPLFICFFLKTCLVTMPILRIYFICSVFKTL